MQVNHQNLILISNLEQDLIKKLKKYLIKLEIFKTNIINHSKINPENLSL